MSKLLQITYCTLLHSYFWLHAQFVLRNSLRTAEVTMSGGLETLAMKEDDVKKMLAAGSHLGDANVHFQMSDYIYKTKTDGGSLCIIILLK